MNTDFFDEDAYNRELGLDGSDDSDTEVLTADDDSKEALKNIINQGSDPQAQNQPQEDLPEFLASRQIEKPEDTPIDWVKAWTDEFKAPPEEGQEVTAESYAREAVRRTGEAKFWAAHTERASLQAIVDETVPALKVVEEATKARLEKAGLQSELTINNELSELIREGELTTKGKAEYDRIKGSAKLELDTLKQGAKEWGETFANNLGKFYEVLPTQTAELLKSMGVELDEGDVERIYSRVKSAAGENWLANHETFEDAARKSAMLAIFSDPYLLAQRDKQIFQAGQKYEESRRRAKRLS